MFSYSYAVAMEEDVKRWERSYKRLPPAHKVALSISWLYNDAFCFPSQGLIVVMLLCFVYVAYAVGAAITFAQKVQRCKEVIKFMILYIFILLSVKCVVLINLHFSLFISILTYTCTFMKDTVPL